MNRRVTKTWDVIEYPQSTVLVRTATNLLQYTSTAIVKHYTRTRYLLCFSRPDRTISIRLFGYQKGMYFLDKGSKSRSSYLSGWVSAAMCPVFWVIVIIIIMRTHAQSRMLRNHILVPTVERGYNNGLLSRPLLCFYVCVCLRT